MVALAVAPLGVSEKSQFLRPMTKGLIERSAWLLEISSQTRAYLSVDIKDVQLGYWKSQVVHQEGRQSSISID